MKDGEGRHFCPFLQFQDELDISLGNDRDFIFIMDIVTMTDYALSVSVGAREGKFVPEARFRPLGPQR